MDTPYRNRQRIAARLEQIRDRAGVFAKLGPMRSAEPARGIGAASVNAGYAFAADGLVLLAAVEAALAKADDWEAEIKRIEPSGADAVQPAMPGNYLVSGRTGALEDCAAELREAIRTALAGEAGDC